MPPSVAETPMVTEAPFKSDGAGKVAVAPVAMRPI